MKKLCQGPEKEKMRALPAGLPVGGSRATARVLDLVRAAPHGLKVMGWWLASLCFLLLWLSPAGAASPPRMRRLRAARLL
jgi:hypothetical protein